MIKDNKLVRIFVAMPGTRQSIGGEAVPWPEPKEIEIFFFKKVAARLRKDLRCPVIFNIEKEKLLSGTIYESMFGETWQADVYIADLTGHNANVYLELGVRWALKDNVTILVSQDVSNVKFNAAFTRVIPYGKDPSILEQAIEDVVQAIKEGIAKQDHIDSPVRSTGKITAMSKDEVEAYENRIKQLEEEIKELKLAQGRNFLDIAKSAHGPEQRISMYTRAIETNPALIDAYLPLAEEQKLLGSYKEAVTILKQATSYFPSHGAFYRELGVVYKKLRLLEQAEEALRTAVRLDSADGESLSNLGGLLRDKGMKNKPYSWDVLREARNNYQKALAINDRDAYALGNVARLDLLLSKIEPERKSAALDELDTLEPLCRFELKKNPTDYWRQFDLADTYILSGKVNEGCDLYSVAVKAVPQEHRAFVLSSVIFPLEGFLAINVLEEPIAVAVQKVIEDLKLAQAPTVKLLT